MIQKQAVPISFAQGLDTKTDPKQVSVGKFLSLKNSVFDKGGLLQKRNGYAPLTNLPAGNNSTYLTTLNDNLTAIGDTVSAFSQGSDTWVTKGTIQPMEVNVLHLIRNNVNQIQVDAAIASSGLVCTVYSENNGSSISYKYAVADSVTGQNIISPIAIPVSSGTVTGSPRVFLLGKYFLIVFTNVITATSHLQYIAVNITNPTIVTANTDIASSYISSTTLSWDGVVANNNFYVAYNTTTGGQSVKYTYLTATLTLLTAHTLAGSIATLMTLSADSGNPSKPIIYISFYDVASHTGYIAVIDNNLNLITAPVQFIPSGTFLNLASAAQNGSVTVFYEASNNYSYDSSIPSHFINKRSMTQAGVLSSVVVSIRSVGLASKAFIVNGVEYYLAAFQSPFQPTYFLINGSVSTSASPVVSGKLAYENGGGYLTLGLPNVTVTDNVAQIAYLRKDLIEALNTLSNTEQTTTGGIYSQTGINLGTFAIGTQDIVSAEIASALHISGGFLWEYDGYLPVEHNFFLWPDSVKATWSDTGGDMVANPPGWVANQPSYFYQAVYSWSDNQGNVHRSAPSIPVPITFASPNASTTGSVTIDIPTLRLTYKTANPVKIELYRWSVANQVYYQVSQSASQANPVLAPLLNSTTTDSVTFVDTWEDASIIGNNIIYTTGGVVEDVNAPASNLITLADSRLWLVDAEDPNLLWFSKQCIEAVPVEMSDLFTLFIAPTTASEGSTGPITAIAPMDGNLIIFKNNAIYYINLSGGGPDNTGANSQYSQPIFITSVVGCSNQKSIVFTNEGLVFQSSKGIWLLSRSLTPQYIGAPVEEFNASIVQSAVNVPLTNQVRFTLDTGETLMLDYYYSQWGTFAGVPAISSCIYKNYHTFLNSYGAVLKETPGVYLDGTNPVLMSFLTGNIQLQGVSGYQRIFEIQLLGQYVSPHLLNVQLGYNFEPLSEQALITPINFTGVYGSDQLYGQTSPFGGPGVLEQWRIQPSTQKCQAFQMSLEEVFDPSFGTVAGAGFTLSAMTCVLGLNRGYRPVKAATTVGTS